MKPACRFCDHAFLNLDAAGARQPLDIKCEIDGAPHERKFVCSNFISGFEQTPSCSDSER